MTNKSILESPIATSVFRLRMRALNAVVLICMLSAPLSTDGVWAVAVQDERAAREQCSASFFSQVEVRECLEKKARASEVALKRVEEKALSAIARWDEDAKYISIAKAKLKTSGEEFVKYRDAHCAYMSSLGGGAIGNALEMRRLACVFELNSRRAEQLSSSIVDLPRK
jgi:uncharacterized protein YecT (DUF1311 family)